MRYLLAILAAFLLVVFIVVLHLNFWAESAMLEAGCKRTADVDAGEAARYTVTRGGGLWRCPK